MNRPHALKEVFKFFVLTLGASYFVFWGPLAVFHIPAISFVTATPGPWWAVALFLVGGFVPSLVGVFLTWKWEGKSGLRQLGQRVIQFKIGWRWYLAAIAIVTVTTLGQIMILQLLGISFDLTLFLTQLWMLLPLLILGPLSEELGWRGYALDRLQNKWSPLLSSLILGVLWSLWHLPLFYIPGEFHYELALPFLPFLLTHTSLSLIYTWLHNHTGGAIWTAIFFHWLHTYASTVVDSGAVRSPLYNWTEFIPIALVSIFIFVVGNTRPQPSIKPAQA